MKLIWLIKRLSRENTLRGAPHVEKELTLLGHSVGEATVAKYMVKPWKGPSQTWYTFLANHMNVAAACDFFGVPILTFELVSCLVVMSHDRRRNLHINVTTNSTALWTLEQIQQAFSKTVIPRYRSWGWGWHPWSDDS